MRLMCKKVFTRGRFWGYCGAAMNANTDHIDLLNQVQKIIIAQANATGINLADEFASVEDFKQFVIAFAFKGLRDAGADVDAAFDAVTGKGEYDAMFARATA